MGKLNIKTLLQSGLADTRIDDIYKAAEEVHYAVSKLDKNSLETLKGNFPALLKVAQSFGKGHPYLNEFKD
tara:strand:+ start:38 stop:250 length:213 start_codon:yes stop_codon:yes gene_type:complete